MSYTYKVANKFAAMAQMVERVLGKDEVTGSIPVSSSKIDKPIPNIKWSRFVSFFAVFAAEICVFETQTIRKYIFTLLIVQANIKICWFAYFLHLNIKIRGIIIGVVL